MNKYQLSIIGFLLIVFWGAEAKSQEYTARGSCLTYAYQQAMKYSQEGNWLGTVAYTQAAIECAKVTNFKDSPESLYRELNEVNVYARNKIYGKEVKGFSLSTPRLSGRLPR